MKTPRFIGAIFFVLWLFFVPFYGLDQGFQYQLTKFIFEKPVQWVQPLLFDTFFTQTTFSSDTVSLFVLTLLLLFVAFIMGGAVLRRLRHYTKFTLLLSEIIRYYLVFVLMKYGFDKIFKAQFYLPEPNILFTPFGHLDQDILFWSTMGVSYTYSFITGLVEVLVAMLIFFNRTKVFGMCLALLLLAHIFVLNVSFNISVKLFSWMLMMMVFFLLMPYFRIIYVFFTHQTAIALPLYRVLLLPPKWNKTLRLFLLLVMFIEVLYPYSAERWWYDDKTSRNPLHGAYEIFVQDDILYKYLFIHRENYLILYDGDYTFEDFYFELNSEKNQMRLMDYEGNFYEIHYSLDGQTINWTSENFFIPKLQAEILDWQNMPALQSSFNLFVDQIQ